MLGRVHSLESFGSADGPGVRYLVFLQGCAMRCRYCHNVDTWARDKGTLMSVEEVLDKAERYRGYWGEDGGITVSGGEALLQIDFVTELFEEAKRLQVPVELVREVHDAGRLPVVNFAAGGVAKIGRAHV